MKSYLYTKQHFFTVVVAFLGLLFTGNFALGQNARDYQFSQSVGTYSPITGGTVAIAGSVDNQIVKVALSSSFNYLGLNQDSLTISTNGHISFSSPNNINSVIGSTYRILSTSLSNSGGAVAAFSADLEGHATAEVRYELVANEFVVQWSNYRRFNNLTDTLNFQIRLDTSTGIVKIVYGRMKNAGSSIAYQPQVGLRGRNVTDFNNRSVAVSTGPWINSVEGITNLASCYFSGANPTTTPASGTTFEYSPNGCGVATAGQVSGITLDGASLSWSSTSVSPITGYEYYMSTSNVEPDAGAVVTNVIGNTATVTDLLSNTTYYVWLKTVCSESHSSRWIPLVSFHTLCNSTTIPYYENIESATIPNLPPCTSGEQNGGGNMWVTSNLFGGTVLHYSYHQSNNADAWFYTQGLQLSEGQSYRLSYRYGSGNTYYPEVLNVSLGVDNTASSMLTILTTHNPIEYSDLTTNVIDFFVPSSGVYYIGFQAASEYNQYELYVDDISVELTPTCFEPIAFSTIDATNTQVTINWSEPLVVPTDGYEYYYNTSDSPPTALTAGIACSDTFVTVNTLLPNTNYYFWVRSVCTTNDKSIWSVVYQTSTYCDPITTLPWIENFDDVIGVSGNFNRELVPNCWKGVDQVGVMNDTGSYIEAESGTNALAFRYGTDLTSGAWAITPGHQLEVGNIYRFSFSYRNYNSAPFDTLSLKIGTNQFIGALNTTIGLPLVDIVNTDYQRYYVDFEVSVNGVYFIGMNVKASSAPWYLSVDNVGLAIAPTCIPPTAVSNSFLTNNSVELEWEESIGAVNTYEYFIRSSTSVPTDDSTGIIINGTSVSLSDLAPNTTYRVWVRSNCSGENSEWTFVHSFKTKCDAVTDIPWVDNFDAISDVDGTFVAGRMPDCWLGEDQVGIVNDANQYIFARSGTNVLAFRYATNINTGAWAITPGFELRADSSYRFKFYYRNYDETPYQSLTVMLGEEPSPDALINQIGTALVNIYTTDYHEYHVDFNVTTDGVYYIGLNAFANYSPWFLMVDDVSLDYSPSCIDPSNVSLTGIAANSAIITWDPSSTIDIIDYEFYVSTSSNEPDDLTEGQSVNTTVCTVGSLEASTTYYFWVRTKCTATAYSPWSDYMSFTTNCDAEVAPTVMQDFTSFQPDCWVTGVSDVSEPYLFIPSTSYWEEDGFGGNGTTGAAMINLYGNNIDWLISNPIDLGTTPGLFRLNYEYAVIDYYSGFTMNNLGNHSVKVIISTDGGLTWDATNIIFNHSGTLSNRQNRVVVDLSAYSGVVKIAFMATSNGTAPDIKFFVDNFVVEAIPSCVEPVSTTIYDVTRESATVQWVAPSTPPALGYQFYISSDNIEPNDNLQFVSVITGTTAVIDDLDANTTYYVWVRSICSSSDTSSWLAAGSFMTSCQSIDVPYHQDFETSVLPFIPSCTEVQTVQDSNPWYVDSYEGSNVLVYEYSELQDANTWFFTQGINLIAGTSYRITYDYSAMGYTESMKVAYGTGPNGASMTNVLVDYPSFNFEEFHEDHVDFTPTASGVYFFGFHAYSSLNQYMIYLDNIVVDFSPCGSEVSISGGGLVCNGDDLSAVTINVPLNGDWTFIYSTGTTTETISTTITNNSFNFIPTITGTYALISAQGSCSSPVLLGEATVEERDLITSTNVQTICSDQTYIIGDSEYETSGNYFDVFTSRLTGCDSTVNTILTVLPPLTSTQNVTICEGHVWNVGPNSYYSTGTYTTLLESVNGCDSTVITHLELVTIVPIVSHNNEVFYIEPVLHATYQWINCETDSVVVTTANFTATENGSYRLRITLDQCSEATNCYTVEGLSVQKVDPFQVELLPNPTKGIVHVTTEGTMMNRIEVLDVNGRVVKDISPNHSAASLDLDSFDSGVYLVHIYSDSNRVIRRVIKQ